MPRSPAISSTGSPGASRISAKVSNVTPRKVGMTRLARVRMNRSMPKARKGEARALPPAHCPSVSPLLQIHAVEGVAAERAELEVHDFLAHRLVLHRMRDRVPRRLFLED